MTNLRTTKRRISKKLFSELPEPAIVILKQMQQRHPTVKSVTVIHVDSAEEFYVGEGQQFWFGNHRGEFRQAEVVSEFSLGATGLFHGIGTTFHLRAGAVCLIVDYYTRFLATLYIVDGKDAFATSAITPTLCLKGGNTVHA